MGTFVVGGVLAIIVVLIIRSMINKKKNGGGCSCGCSSCGSNSICHKK